MFLGSSRIGLVINVCLRDHEVVLCSNLKYCFWGCLLIFVTCLFQIWAVVDVVLNRRNILHRVLARREGVTIDNPVGTHWESGFGVSSIHLPLVTQDCGDFLFS